MQSAGETGEMTTKITRQDAIDFIDAYKRNGSWMYFARETSETYRLSEDDIDYLVELMNHEDDDIRRDAYSHWCTGSGELVV